MLYEIYIFLWVSVLIIILLFYRFFSLLFTPFVIIWDYIKKEYYKIFKLNSIKKQILEEDGKHENVKWVFTKSLDLINIFSKNKPIEKEIITDKNKVLKNKSKINNLFLKAEVAKQKWKIEDFEKILIEILSIDENNIKALDMLSNLYINLWKDKKAFSLLKRLIQLDMENDSAIWNLSKLYLELWEIDTARILIEKALSLNSHNHRYYVTYADILYNKWELEKAIDAIKNVLEIKPKNVIYLDALASLYEEIWDDAQAKAYWLQVLDLEPDYEKAKEKLKEI